MPAVCDLHIAALYLSGHHEYYWNTDHLHVKTINLVTTTQHHNTQLCVIPDTEPDILELHCSPTVSHTMLIPLFSWTHSRKRFFSFNLSHAFLLLKKTLKHLKWIQCLKRSLKKALFCPVAWCLKKKNYCIFFTNEITNIFSLKPMGWDQEMEFSFREIFWQQEIKNL